MRSKKCGAAEQAFYIGAVAPQPRRVPAPAIEIGDILLKICLGIQKGENKGQLLANVKWAAFSGTDQRGGRRKTSRGIAGFLAKKFLPNDRRFLLRTWGGCGRSSQKYFTDGGVMDRLYLARAFFCADFKTGLVTWRVDPDPALFSHAGWRAWHMRERAGKPVVFYEGSGSGHKSVKVRHTGRNVTLFAHRIVWALAHNDYPNLDLDHVNNDPSDNRLANLRPATRGQNATNSRRIRCGLKGAYETKKRGRWFSMVWRNGRLTHLGTFDSAEAAHSAWAEAKKAAAGDFFNPGYPNVFD